MRHYMVDPDNEERLLKVPPHVVDAIRAEALDEARAAVLRLEFYASMAQPIPRDNVLAAIDALRGA